MAERMTPARRRYFPLVLAIILGTALSGGLYALATVLVARAPGW
jgi:hypothetical protein